MKNRTSESEIVKNISQYIDLDPRDIRGVFEAFKYVLMEDLKLNNSGAIPFLGTFRVSKNYRNIYFTPTKALKNYLNPSDVCDLSEYNKLKLERDKLTNEIKGLRVGYALKKKHLEELDEEINSIVELRDTYTRKLEFAKRRVDKKNKSTKELINKKNSL